MAKDFSTYLDVPVDDVPTSIPSLPRGHYFADVKGWKGEERDYDKANGGPKTPVVCVTFSITGADDDVEFDATSPAGSEVGKLVSRDYALNDADKAGLVMLRRLAEDTLKLPTKGLQLSDMLNTMIGQPCKVFNEPRAGKEEGQFFANIKKVLPAD